MSSPVPSVQERATAVTVIELFAGTGLLCSALDNFKKKLTLPLAGMVPAVLSEDIDDTGNLINVLDNSADDVVFCP